MKNVLLATTAIALTAGYAAAEMSISATAKIAYGNFGEEHKAGSSSKVTTSAEAGATVAAAGTMPSTKQSTATSGTGGSTLNANTGVYTAGTKTAMVKTETESTDGEKLTANNAVRDAEKALAVAQAASSPNTKTIEDAKVALADAIANAAVINDTAAATIAGAGYAYSDTFDVVVSGSGEAGGVAYSASMTIDEDAASNSVGTLSMSTNGFTLAYGADDFGDLVADSATGLEEAAGDIKLSYAANGISASYEMDEAATNPYYMRAGYTNGALTVGLEIADTDGSGAGKAVNTISLAYTMGALTVSYDVDDKASVAGDNSTGSDYDAKITYTLGDTVLSAGTDEVESHYAGIATTVGGLTLSMRTEQDGKKCVSTVNNRVIAGTATKHCGSTTGTAHGANLASAENELSLSYTMGALTVAYAKDTGDAGKFGDEAETLTTLTYDLGGVKIVAKGNDQDETEVSAAFTF